MLVAAWWWMGREGLAATQGGDDAVVEGMGMGMGRRGGSCLMGRHDDGQGGGEE